WAFNWSFRDTLGGIQISPPLTQNLQKRRNAHSERAMAYGSFPMSKPHGNSEVSLEHIQYLAEQGRNRNTTLLIILNGNPACALWVRNLAKALWSRDSTFPTDRGDRV